MTHRFGPIEIDEEKRALRVQGREVSTQPRVFDLLVYLVRNRDRVVGKEELLNKLWPDVIVADGSLQRAISLARSALRRGGADQAIRTYAREGYRFCAERLDPTFVAPAEAASREGVGDALEKARQALDRGDWEEALCEYPRADREAPLVARELERWAYAAQCGGRVADAVQPLERAVAAYGMRGDRRGAARAALALARIHFEQMKGAVAEGWHRRARTLLAAEAETEEHGHLAWLASRFSLVEGRIDDALAHAERATEIGRRLADTDVEVLGLLYHGLALLARGDTRGGAALHDEAAAAVLTGQVSPLVGGLIYCGVLWGCRNVCDWNRAAQWSQHFKRWCEQSGLSAFPGVCRLHRAEVLGILGNMEEAEKEIRESFAHLPTDAPWAEGDAHRVLGDLHLARGDLRGAEEEFRRAHELGWDPQPGYALVQVARGHPEAAARALERTLADSGWCSAQRRGLLLAHLVFVALAARDEKRARSALEELEARPELWSTPALEAEVLRARAEVARADGHAEDAVLYLTQALAIWQRTGSPLRAAAARLHLARLLKEVGDAEAFHLEVAAAESACRKLGAAALVRVCEDLRRVDQDLTGEPGAR